MGRLAGELQTENIINFLSIFSNDHCVQTVFGWKNNLRNGRVP
jgi:hypothetical protein